MVGERLGIEIDAGQRWKDEDKGMHVFAAALYSLMKQEKYDGRQGNFRDFLLDLLRSGRLAPGKIKDLSGAFYGLGTHRHCLPCG